LDIKRLILGPLETNCYIVYDKVSKEAAIFDPANDCDKIIAVINEEKLFPKYIVITHAHFDHISALDDLREAYDAKICISIDDKDALNNKNQCLCTYFGCEAPRSKADIIINDGDAIYLGDNKILFIKTPGHTIGSICAYFDNSLISGDTIFYESVGRTDLPGGNRAKLISSIKEKIFTLPSCTDIYPGHGEKTTIDHEKNNNPYIW